MEKSQTFTREKHLDHLVRVVPLLCLAYGIQSYLMMSYAGGGPTGALVFLLGVSLAVSVVALVAYDQRHHVSWSHEGFEIRAPWSWSSTIVARESIAEIEVTGTPDEFQTVAVKLRSGKRYTFYFVDNGHEFKASMEHKAQEIARAA